MWVRPHIHALANVKMARAKLIDKAKGAHHCKAARWQNTADFKRPQIMRDRNQAAFNGVFHPLLSLFAGRSGANGKRMNALAGQVAQCSVYHPLAFQPADTGKGLRFDLDRKMALA
jgi:hypothetical protein